MVIAKEKDKLEKLARYLNVNVEELAYLLNPSMVLDDITTFDEARTIYNDAPSGSELENAALAKMTEIGMTMLATATFDEAEMVYDNAPSGSELEKAALVKMLELV